MSKSITTDLLAALNIVAMERLGDGSFSLVSTTPDWFKQFCEQTATSQEVLNIEESFPFLGSFLIDAERFWSENSPGRLKSGPWTEVDPLNNECHLEASALCLSGRMFLLIELLGNDYEEKQLLLQKLRENSLNYDRVIKEIRAEVLSNTKAIDLSGQTLNGQYELQGLIGQGGLGAVYKALDLNTGQIVAVKLLLEDTDNTIFSQQLFEREIKILKRVHHPNIVSILDSGMSPTGRLFLVMEFIEGKPLDDLLSEGGIWSIERTLRLLRHLCPALYAIHQKNIIHRDLKPANIIIKNPGCSDENPMLLDLGIAKMIRGGNETGLLKTITQTGMILGTVQYLAPEQCLDQEIDEGVDIYALGMIVFELLAGDLPLSAQSVNGWMMAHVHGRPISMRSLNSRIPEEVEKVVLSTLAKKRKDRPASTIEFLENFETAVRGMEPVTDRIFSLADEFNTESRITDSVELFDTSSNKGSSITSSNKENLPTIQSPVPEE
jgi:serine/threonine protein kinase